MDVRKERQVNGGKWWEWTANKQPMVAHGTSRAKKCTDHATASLVETCALYGKYALKKPLTAVLQFWNRLIIRTLL